MPKAFLATTLCAAAFAASAEPATFVLDPDHSVITFEALHMGTSTQRGRVQPTKASTVTIDRAAKSGKADITIDLATITTATASLQGFLRGDRMFNVAVNPTAHFVADTFVFDGDKLASVSGTLTLNGKSQPLALKATRFNCYENSMLKREVCGGDFEGKFRRSQYGLGALAEVTPDEIPLLVQVEGIRQ
jgi:polyisoprenoid-binding protein YceI